MKKLLALVLALVMSMSLVTISNAADFKDADKISYKEAVEVMNAVGVLKGYDNGDFGATDTLTRAQAAKIIAYLDLGEEAADALVGTGKVFSDVLTTGSTAWAAGYIEYCAKAGYVSGIGDGKFAPNDQVTGLQFAKMLLAVLGYNATIEGMTGADWSINVAKLAATSKLFKSVSGASTAVLTREKAAQMALNALKATMVEYDSTGTTVKGEGFEVITGASKATKVVDEDTKYNKIGKDTNTDGDFYVELGEKLYDGKLALNTGDTDGFGRDQSVWSYKGVDVYTVSKEADLTYYGPVKVTKLYADLGLGETLDAENVNVKANYPLAQEDEGHGIFDVVKKNSDDKYGLDGQMIQVYKTTNDDGVVTSIDVFFINYVVATVEEIEEADKDADTKRTITLSGDANAYETESFEKDDVVLVALYTEDSGDIEANDVADIQLAKSVEGKVASTKGSKATIGGTEYTVANNTDVTGELTVAAGNEGTFYFGIDGTIVKADSTEKTGKYVYIYNVAKKTDTNEDGKDDKATYTAYYVDQDGVKGSSVLKTAKNDADKTTVLKGQVVDGKFTNAKYTDDFNGVYEYKISNSKLVAVSDKIESVEDKLDDAALTDASAYANSKTKFVFVYEDDDVMTSKVVTGFANVDEYNDDVDVYVVKNSSDIATIVFVTDEPASATSDKNVAVLLSTKATITMNDKDEEVYTYDVMIDGKKTTLVGDVDTFAGYADGDAFTYKLKDNKIEDGSNVKYDFDVELGTVDKVLTDENTIVIDGNAYKVASDVVVYKITEKDGDVKVTATTLSGVAKDNLAAGYWNDQTGSKKALKVIVVDKREA